MDINIFRGIVTAVLMGLFIALCVWAWSSKRKADFEAASRLPLDDGPVSGPDSHEKETRQ